MSATNVKGSANTPLLLCAVPACVLPRKVAAVESDWGIENCAHATFALTAAEPASNRKWIPALTLFANVPPETVAVPPVIVPELAFDFVAPTPRAKSFPSVVVFTENAE